MALALTSGTRIGGFELADVIGRGGFGITYRAVDSDSRSVYAIKEYLPEDFAYRDRAGTVGAVEGQADIYQRGLEAFLSEANILKNLPRRAGLVRVRGAFQKFGTAYCVMEFIEGDSLQRMSRRMNERAGHIPEVLMIDLAVSVLWAMGALHQRNIIHRDVKPANIMIRRSGDPVLIDFGAARRLSRRGEHDKIFTRTYAAIEQFPPELTAFGRSFEEGSWSDLYSLSVVLYELIAQELPPDARTRAEAVLSGRGDPYVPLADKIAGTARADKYRQETLSAVDSGLGLMPATRPQSARAYAELLRPGCWTERTTRMDTNQIIASPAGHRRLPLFSWLLLVSAILGAVLLWADHTSIERF